MFLKIDRLNDSFFMKFSLFFISFCFSFFCNAQEGELNGKLILDTPEDYENIANKTKVYIETEEKTDSTIVNDSLYFSFKKLNYGKIKLSFKPESITRTVYLINIDKNTNDIIAELPYSLTCKYDKSIDNKMCPVCKKDDMVLPVAYGLIPEGRFTNENEKDEEKKTKNYISGGCVVTNCDPNWYCKRDDLKF